MRIGLAYTAAVGLAGTLVRIGQAHTAVVGVAGTDADTVDIVGLEGTVADTVDTAAVEFAGTVAAGPADTVELEGTVAALVYGDPLQHCLRHHVAERLHHSSPKDSTRLAVAMSFVYLSETTVKPDQAQLKAVFTTRAPKNLVLGVVVGFECHVAKRSRTRVGG